MNNNSNQMEEIVSNIQTLNSNTLHEVDHLTLMVDTQRAIIRILQQKIKELES